MVIFIPGETGGYPRKAAVIIDGGYWRSRVNNLELEDIDLVSFSDACAKPAFRIRTTFFDGKKRENQSFHDSIKLLNRFDVFLGDIVNRPFYCRHCHKENQIDVQKRVDVALAGELVHLASTQQVDIICLIAGDQDFLPAIETAKRFGVIIRLYYFKNAISDNLLKSVDERIEIKKKFLDDNSVNYTSKEIEQEEESQEEIIVEQEINIVSEEITNVELLDEINTIYTNSLASEVFLSFVGGQLGTKLPNWKENYRLNDISAKNLTLKSIIQEIAPNYEFIQYGEETCIRDQSQVTPRFKEFFMSVVNDMDIPEDNLISLSSIAIKLTEKNQDWRIAYFIKQFKKRVEVLDEFELVNKDNYWFIRL